MDEYGNVLSSVKEKGDYQDTFREIITKDIPNQFKTQTPISDPYRVVGSYGKGAWANVPWKRMTSLPTGSDELIYIQTEQVSVIIKGQPPYSPGAGYLEKESFLKVFCDERYEIGLKGDTELVSEQTMGNAYLAEYKTVPIFYEQQHRVSYYKQ